jgi:hypothetical protein
MPAEVKPLFRADALRPRLAGYALPVPVENSCEKLKHWVDLFGAARPRFNETELLADFISLVFGEILGYVGPAAGEPIYTLRREALIEVDGKRADAALGRFSATEDSNRFIVAVEGKGPRDPLDRPFAGRPRSAVEQALQYAVNLQIDWFLVTNMREIRLYHKGHDLFSYERFETAKLAVDFEAQSRFAFLLGAQRVTPDRGGNHLDELLLESARIGQKLTNDYYKEYAFLRRQTFDELRRKNPSVPPGELLTLTQKLLDRILFVAFCEDRGLLPSEIISKAYEQRDDFNPKPIWENFKGLFNSIDKGNERLDIARYNGGLFETDPRLDALIVPDVICKGFNKLATYEYGHWSDDPNAKLIDVEILGHIFEQSITDLEELQFEIEAGTLYEQAGQSTGGSTGKTTKSSAKSKAKTKAAKPAGPSKRKKEGAFYTPAFVTRYIVSETLKPILAERFETFRGDRQDQASKTHKSLLADPGAIDPDTLNAAQKKVLAEFWSAWWDELTKIRIVDPACGSGAFLIEAYEQLHLEYDRCIGWIEEYSGRSLFDVDKSILENNLYGMDLNAEAIEIARLSLWIKTATKGKVLTTLDATIRQGNSIIAETAPLDAWRKRFPAAFADDGFDVVIGNPPYVRQEWISKDKPYLEEHYRAYDGAADLYVYFYELGLKLLKPGGRMGLIVTNKWLKAGYGEALRQHFGTYAWVEQIVDFGHAKQIFPDADVFPCILIARKPKMSAAPATTRACVIPREQLRIDDLSRQVTAQGIDVPRNRFGGEPWNLEPPGVTRLMEKIKVAGPALKEFAGRNPIVGIKTALNDAYLLTDSEKKNFEQHDPESAALFKPYLRGQDIERWHPEWKGLWMLALKSSGNHPWPWSDSGSRAEAIFAKEYPAVFAHMNKHRDALSKRQDQGTYWWELRSCAYWDKFDEPKIIYPEITWRAQWCFDTRGLCINNTVYILPTTDLWILAVANSPLMWSYTWRYAIHGKDEALRFIREFVQDIPIANPSELQRDSAEKYVKALIDQAANFQSRSESILDWLRHEFDVAKPTQRLQNLAALDADAFIAEVKKSRGKGKALTVPGIQRLTEEHARSVVPLQTLAAETQVLERRIADLVNEAYGLTPEEVQLMWDTAPPRMPVGRQ